LDGALATAAVFLREFLNSAKGADARHQAGKGTRGSLHGVLATATVLRGFLNSAKDADARHQAGKGTRGSLHGALATATVSRGSLNSAKDADAPPGRERNSPVILDGALATAAVFLREFLNSAKGADGASKQGKEPAALWVARLLPRPFCAGS
jgi:hypothetical protein